MENFLSTHKYFHVIVLCAGLLLQALFANNIVIDIIGYILIAISPIKLYTDYMERVYEDPGNKNEGKWLPIPEAKLTELLSYVPAKISTSPGRSTSSKGFGVALVGYIIVLIITAIICFIIFNIIYLSDLSYGHVFVIDLPMLIMVLVAFSGPTVAPHPLSIQVNALSVFQSMQLPDSFYKRFEARLVKDVNDEPDILDVRLQIRPREPFEPLLCMMATISRTKVQDSVYPYAYFVLVFKGDKIASSSTPFSSDLINMTYGSPFTVEASVQKGDSVIVVLPRLKTKYTTNIYDCSELSTLMVNTCKLLDKHKDEIIRLCK